AGAARAVNDALEPAVARQQLQLGRQEWPVVRVGSRVQEVNAGQVALAAPGGIQATRAADRQRLGPVPLLLQPAKEVIESHAVAADDDEIRRPQPAAEQMYVHDFADFEVLALAGNDRKS